MSENLEMTLGFILVFGLVFFGKLGLRALFDKLSSDKQK